MTCLLQYDFEELIRRVAKDTPAIVPIINFKEIPKEDWKRLPDIISSGLGVRTDFVICTHFDQVTPFPLFFSHVTSHKIPCADFH